MAYVPRLAASFALATGVCLGSASIAHADCKDDSQCKSPRICDANACVEPRCAADTDCPTGATCARGRCAARAGACKSDVDCPGTQLCVEAACRAAEQTCKSDVDCPGEEICNAGVCRAQEQAAPPPPPVPAPTAPPVQPPPPNGVEPMAALPPATGADAATEQPPVSRAAGMFIGAGILFGAAYLLSLPVTAAASDGRATGDAAIPFAGPILILAEHELTAGGTAYYVTDTALQFTSLLLVGFAIHEAATSGSGGEDTAVRVSAVAPDGRGPGLGLGFQIP